MKKIVLLFFIFSVLIFADTDVTTFSEVQQRFASYFEGFLTTFQSSAKGLLYSLGVISLVISFGLMAMRGELEFGAVAAQLIKFALIIGFFSMLISSPSWLKNIFNAVNNLAISAGGEGAKLDQFMLNLGDMWDKVIEAAKQNGFSNVGNTILQILAAFLVTIPLVLMAGNALMYYAFSVLSINIGILFLGFAGLEQTRPWAINALANIFRNALKWMLQVLIMAVAFNFVAGLSNAIGTTPTFQNLLALLIVIFLLYSVNMGISGFVDSYFTGSGGGENNRGMQMATALMSGMAAGAAGAAMGAYQGAKGASDTIAAAAATGEEKSTLGKAASYFGGMASGVAKGAMHGGGNFAQNWAKTIDPNSTTSSSSSSSGKNFASAANEKNTSDGDVGGAAKGSFAEPKVGGEINPNQSDKS